MCSLACSSNARRLLAAILTVIVVTQIVQIRPVERSVVLLRLLLTGVARQAPITYLVLKVVDLGADVVAATGRLSQVVHHVAFLFRGFKDAVLPP